MLSLSYIMYIPCTQFLEIEKLYIFDSFLKPYTIYIFILSIKFSEIITRFSNIQ